MPEPQNLHIDGALTNFSLQYRNEAFIWPEVMPSVKVNHRSDKYFVYGKDQRFRIPDDKIGPKSMANEIELEVSEDNYSVTDHSLSGWVTKAEEDNADAPLSPQLDVTQFVAERLHLAQEKRVADKVFNSANYPTANKVALSGASQWGGASQDPLNDILTGLDTAFMRPNVIVFGAEAWKVFRTSAKVLDAVKSGSRVQAAAGGMATAPEVANLFEVDKIIIGRARYTASKQGQTATYSRLWGKHCALLYVAKEPTVRSVTFGLTFAEMSFSTMKSFDDKRGIKGATYIKTAWNSDEKIVASDVGYFIQDAVA